MRKLSVFNNISLDGYFTSTDGDMSWAYPSAEAAQDAEWQAFTAQNASGGGELLFGRITYEQMKSFWPTPAAAQQMPEVAKGMNEMKKTVISRSLTHSDWQNTGVASDLIATARRLRDGDGPGVTILGSGQIVAQLSEAGLIDEYSFVTCPLALGAGRTLFDGMTHRLDMELQSSRSFRNGRVFSIYQTRR